MPIHLNWVDYVIIIFLLYETYQGWEEGLIYLATSFFAFALALWLAIVSNGMVSAFLVNKFGIASTWSSVIAYVGVAFMTHLFISQLLLLGISRLPDNVVHSKYTNWLGAIVSILNGIVIAALLLLVALALPFRGTVKTDIQQSTIGRIIVDAARQYGGPISSVIDQAGQAATKFITIDPGSTETIKLDVAPKASELKVDVVDERTMVNMVNAERIAAGVQPVTATDALTTEARDHSSDMFLRRYFSHITPEGKGPGDRLTAAGISFTAAGENLAYAPTVEQAHTGLMNSPEHKKNILDPEFHQIGIGIISTDSFGIMVTQDFTN